MGHRLAYLFAYTHLPEHLQDVSRPFAELANALMYGATPMLGTYLAHRAPETTEAALWRLWEAKNLAVVAAAQDGAV